MQKSYNTKGLTVSQISKELNIKQITLENWLINKKLSL